MRQVFVGMTLRTAWCVYDEDLLTGEKWMKVAKMSQRLIDATELPKLFDAEYKQTMKLILNGEKHLDNLAEGFTEAIHIVKYIAPTIDAVPVVHGRWIEGRYPLKCTVCHGLAKKDFRGGCWNYCPNCGAKMDGGPEMAHLTAMLVCDEKLDEEVSK